MSTPKDGTQAVPTTNAAATGGPNLTPLTLGNDPNDSRVGWVYLLRKHELEVELAKFKLSTAGTVDEMRRRLAKFIQEGRASPTPGFAFPAASTTTTVTTTTAPTVTVTTPAMSNLPVATQSAQQTTGPTANIGVTPLRVRDWQITFSGTEDPAAFLERLEEIRESQGIHPDRLLQAMPELLQGMPALWFRNNRRFWTNWGEFCGAFQDFFFPVNYRVDLEAAISRRVHSSRESTAT